MVRQRSAKPLFSGSNPDAASILFRTPPSSFVIAQSDDEGPPGAPLTGSLVLLGSGVITMMGIGLRKKTSNKSRLMWDNDRVSDLGTPSFFES